MIRAYGLDIPESIEEAIDLDRTALLVYDMQVGILRQLGMEANHRQGRRRARCGQGSWT
jgi:isochorismate hydrolase